MACMPTLRGVTHLEEWPNSLSILVCSMKLVAQRASGHAILLTEMLTPIDQPLDKLEDLTPEEMCVVHSRFLSVIVLLRCTHLYPSFPLHVVKTCGVRALVSVWD